MRYLPLFCPLSRLFTAWMLLLAMPAFTEQSADAGKELPPRVLPDVTHMRQSDLNQYLKMTQRGQEIVELQADGTPFTGLLMLSRSSDAQGGALILHDNGQHGHWPVSTAPLREELPTYGWTTLSIGLPDVPEARFPHSHGSDTDTPNAISEEPALTAKNTTELNLDSTNVDTPKSQETLDSNGLALSGEAQTELSGNEPALPELESLPPIPEPVQETPAAKPNLNPAEVYRTQMLGRIDAAVNELNQQGQLNIVIIANGHTAAWAVAWLQQKNLGQTANAKGFSLILIDALDDAYAPVSLTTALAQLDMPILDLITGLNRNQEYANVQREGAMKRNARTLYKQIKLPTVMLEEDYGNQLVRRIRGWLKTNAAGMEAQVK